MVFDPPTQASAWLSSSQKSSELSDSEERDAAQTRRMESRNLGESLSSTVVIKSLSTVRGSRCQAISSSPCSRTRATDSSSCDVSEPALESDELSSSTEISFPEVSRSATWALASSNIRRPVL